MKKNFISADQPSVNLCINKSRTKLYNKNTEIPVYYLKSGTEFSLELFNPTVNTILAKIYLNNNAISQGGLVIMPGQRIFLDRYFDIPKKFKFDTYEVSNTEEVRKAIQNNGDVKVEFYKEQIPIPYWNPMIWYDYPNYNQPINFKQPWENITYSTDSDNITLTAGINPCPSSCNSFYNHSQSEVTLDMVNQDIEFKTLPKRPNKTLETGRVEAGSYSNQKFESVNKNFEYLPFHTVEYKLLPVSQKVNTVDDLKVKLYCSSCGKKVKPTDSYCGGCGNKI